MCLYKRLIQNKRYEPNKKNKGNPPQCTDERKRYVWAECGRCIECRAKRRREWAMRLEAELKEEPNALFITLTISNSSMSSLRKDANSSRPNDIATLATRRFLERIRKETGKSIRHWIVTELGEEKGRIHLHGIVWSKKSLIKRHWKYGFIFIGDHVGIDSIHYITKYMLKLNENDKNFVGKVLCSKGLGQNYCSTWNNVERHTYKGEDTCTEVITDNGAKIQLPVYWKRKLFTEEERDELYGYNLDRNITYIHGEKISTFDNDEEVNNLTLYYRELMEKTIGEPNWLEVIKDRWARWTRYRKRERNHEIKPPKENGE